MVGACLRTKKPNEMCQLYDVFKGFLALERDQRPTDMDLPQLKFTATQWLGSVKTLKMEGVCLETTAPTFQFNRSVVSKLIWLEFNLNLSHACFEKCSLCCQCGTGVNSNITVRNYQFMRMMIPQSEQTC